MMVLRVLVADDNLIVREGIVKLLDACTDIEVVGACRTYDHHCTPGEPPPWVG